MFDNLSKKIDKAFQLLKGQGQITEINVAETLKEVRRALLEADVNFKIAKESKFFDLASIVLVTSISFSKCFVFTS